MVNIATTSLFFTLLNIEQSCIIGAIIKFATKLCLNVHIVHTLVPGSSAGQNENASAAEENLVTGNTLSLAFVQLMMNGKNASPYSSGSELAPV